MKNKLIHLVCSLVAFTGIPALSYATVTTLDPSNNPADCAKFSHVNTVIAVHEKDCSFGPTLEAKSNAPQYSTLSFYQIVLDPDKKEANTLICGKIVQNYPTVFIQDSKGQEDNNNNVPESNFNDWFSRSLDKMVANHKPVTDTPPLAK